MQGNLLHTRSDLAYLLLDWLRPLKKRFSSGYTQLLVGHTSAAYGENDARMEGYARLLWGIGPLVSQSNAALSLQAQEEIEEWIRITRTGLIHGTDPRHEEYWQDLKDNDHKMVEMAAIANAILLAPHVFWEPLSDGEKENVYHWYDQINQHKIRTNNWISFRILVNVMFCRLGLPGWERNMAQDIADFEANYEDGGWYHDGAPSHKDYYIPFAMHFYGLLFSKNLEQQMPAFSERLKNRAKAFYRDFCHWFDEKGRSVPFGRSLTYRFAHSAAFAAMAFADVAVPMGELKFLTLQNLRYWSSQPIFDNGGVLSIGYGYPNLIMSEMYNAPGSPYWGLKTFLILALEENHPFWRSCEKAPDWESKRYLPYANMISTHEGGDHALLYPAGHFAANSGNALAKYQKFVYSSEFGFSVSRGNTLLDGAFDCTLAASQAGDGFWRMRRTQEKFEVTENCTRVLYELMPGVRVESVVIPLARGHVRVHYIQSDRPVDLADGGFAIASERGLEKIDDTMVTREPLSVCCEFPWGNAGAVNLLGGTRSELITAFPNTNLMHSMTVIPTVMCSTESGHSCFANYFYGSAQGGFLGELPQARITEDTIVITCGDTEITVDGKKWL